MEESNVSLGAQVVANELGIYFEDPIELNSDASAAIGMSNHVGSGNIPHIEWRGRNCGYRIR